MIEDIDRALGRAVADRLLELLRQQDIDELSVELGGLIGKNARRKHVLGPLLSALASMTAELVRENAGPVDDRLSFMVDVRDESDGVVELEELRPSLRAMLRAVLALLSDHPEDADFQLSLAMGDPDPIGRMDALVHSLLWVDGLRSSGEEQDRQATGTG